jgi:hypothetical protein
MRDTRDQTFLHLLRLYLTSSRHLLAIFAAKTIARLKEVLKRCRVNLNIL